MPRRRRCHRGFAEEHGIPWKPIGKLLVATDERELAAMQALVERAAANRIQATSSPPPSCASGAARRRVGALHVASTGITDYATINRRLATLVEEAGGTLMPRPRSPASARRADEVVLSTTPRRVRGSHVVFCAGVQADRVAAIGRPRGRLRHGAVPRGVLRRTPGAGRPRRAPSSTRSPTRSCPFLGVHLTPTVEGGLNVGPNAVLGLAREGYPKFSFDRRDVRDIVTFPGMWHVARANVRTGAREMRNSLSKRGYLRLCQKYCPELRLEDLTPREAGIRAQAVMRDGSFVHDFLLRDTPRTLHVVNAPSPAATSALPIAAMIVDRMSSAAT